MKILLLEAFYGGSHKKWADDLILNSSHEINLYSLPARAWKWRMHGAAIHFAKKYMEDDFYADLILATDMVDFSTFVALCKTKLTNAKLALYFHENQLTYPWSETDEDTKHHRDQHYAFINLTSALTADCVFFNSTFHKTSFLNELPHFLNAFPDYQEKWVDKAIEEKSKVLPIGFSFKNILTYEHKEKFAQKRATILWNHRWEYDKNPEQFFKVLLQLKNNGIQFQLIVLGEKTSTYPKVFDESKVLFKDEIIHFGYVETKAEYFRLLFLADILPVTSIQDFFGISIVEAMYCHVFPLLPNRLVYPEHLPEAYQHTFLYDTEEDLVKRLQRLIFDVKVIRKQNLRQWVEKYDWSIQIEQYDTFFNEIIEE